LPVLHGEEEVRTGLVAEVHPVVPPSSYLEGETPISGFIPAHKDALAMRARPFTPGKLSRIFGNCLGNLWQVGEPGVLGIAFHSLA